jgi:hypothetical protein
MSYLSQVMVFDPESMYQANEVGSPSEITIIGEVSNTGTVAAKTTSSSSTVTSTNTPQSSSSNKGVAVGAGVGVSVGVIVLGLIAGGFYYYGQRQGRKSVDYLSAPSPGLAGDGKGLNCPVSYYSPVAQIPPSELPHSPGSVPLSELSQPLEIPRSELPVDQSWATMNTPWSSPHVY